MDEPETPFKPPYFSFQTFWNFINDLGKKPLPPQIDRSMMESKSGTDQANLTAALKGFGLISDDLSVEPRLEQLVSADELGRKKILAEIVTEYYADPLLVSAVDGTEKLLQDSFRESLGVDATDTRRKAVTFFLHAARAAGMELSPHFPATRASGSGGASGSGKARRPVKRKAAETGAANPDPASSGQEDTYKVDLRCGGSVTLTVTVSHFSLSKNRDDRTFVYALIDALTDYGEVEICPAGQGGQEAPA